MTDDERAALRDEIEGLTIREARKRGELAAETLRVLSELGIAYGATNPFQGVPIQTPHGPQRPPPIAPTACPACGRALDGSAKSFAECQLGVECPAMAHRQTNKPALVHALAGPNGTAVVGDRATLLAQPAFDANGEPVA